MNARLWSNLQHPKQRKNEAAPVAVSRLGATNEELRALGEKKGWHVRPLSANDLSIMSADELLWHEQNNAQNLKAATEQNSSVKPRSEQAERYGWTACELTYKQIAEMGADEAAWHQQFNSKNWRAAFEGEEDRRAGKQHVAKSRIELMWSGHATPEEDEAARIAAEHFTKKFPQFERTIENVNRILQYMRERNYDGTDESSYVRAFRELLDAGQITLKPTESADDFLQKHPELRGDSNGKPITPPLIQARQGRNQATAEHFEKTKAASKRAGSMTVVDYENEQTGYPAAPTKYSFRKLLDSLSADEYQRRANEDPAFVAAIDKLNNGNK